MEQTESNTAGMAKSLSRIMRLMKPLAPVIAGLACSRVAVYAINPSGPLQIDGDMLGNWTSIVKCLPFIAILALVAFNRSIASDRTWGTGKRVGQGLLVLEALCIVGIALARMANIPSTPELQVVAAMASAIGSICSMYWVVQASGTGPLKAIMLIALSRIVSEPFTLAMSLLAPCDVFLGAAAIAGQALCIRNMGQSAGFASKASSPNDAGNQRVTRYFGGLESEFADRKFLIACVTSCILLSAATGLLRAFPDGRSVATPALVLIAASALLLVLYAGMALRAVTKSPLIIVSALWLSVEALAACSLLAYALLPNDLSVGAAFARDFNEVLHAFRLYITIALISIGWRNPYYYVMLTYLLFLFPRAIARSCLLGAAGIGTVDPAVVIAAAAALLIFAGQLPLRNIIDLLAKTTTKAKQQTSTIAEKILGIDEGGSIVKAQEDAMRKAAESIGARFELSEREIEVLALFASGHTQKRVAEELFISKSTAHAHIQHIYTKTGFHSRQDVLNYIKECEG